MPLLRVASGKLVNHMTLRPSGEGDGLDIHRALPAGVRIPSVVVLRMALLPQRPFRLLLSLAVDVNLGNRHVLQQSQGSGTPATEI